MESKQCKESLRGLGPDEAYAGFIMDKFIQLGWEIEILKNKFKESEEEKLSLKERIMRVETKIEFITFDNFNLRNQVDMLLKNVQTFGFEFGIELEALNERLPMEAADINSDTPEKNYVKNKHERVFLEEDHSDSSTIIVYNPRTVCEIDDDPGMFSDDDALFTLFLSDPNKEVITLTDQAGGLQHGNEGLLGRGAIFTGCFHCAGNHMAANCTLYTEMYKGKCSKCRSKGLDLCHAPEKCQGHTPALLEQLKPIVIKLRPESGVHGYGKQTINNMIVVGEDEEDLKASFSDYDSGPTETQPQPVKLSHRLQRGPCRNWNESVCVFDDLCMFAHITVCSFQENCRNPEKCLFYHLSRSNIVFLGRKAYQHSFLIDSESRRR